MGKFPIELVALTGLFVLGLAVSLDPSTVFSGYGHPALITIISIFIVSQAIISSGALRGLGQLIEKKIGSLQGQIIGLSLRPEQKQNRNIGCLLEDFVFVTRKKTGK